MLYSQWRDHNTFAYKNITFSFITTKRSKGLNVKERQRDRETGDCYNWHYVETDIFRDLLLCQGLWYRPAAWHPPPADLSIPGCSPDEWLPSSSCHYIIFGTLTHTPSGFQFTWFISVVPCLHWCKILF